MEYIVSDVARLAHKKSFMDQLLLDGIWTTERTAGNHVRKTYE